MAALAASLELISVRLRCPRSHRLASTLFLRTAVVSTLYYFGNTSVASAYADPKRRVLPTGTGRRPTCQTQGCYHGTRGCRKPFATAGWELSSRVAHDSVSSTPHASHARKRLEVARPRLSLRSTYTLSFISLYSASVVNVQFRERGGHRASVNRAQLGRVRGLLVFMG